jgi:hypothetical protein
MRAWNPTATLDPAEIERVDSAVAGAIATGNVRALPVIGFGELSIVLAWPTERPRCAVKTAASLPEPEAVAALGALVDRYRDRLAGAGVTSLDTRVMCARSGRGYLVQPLVPESAIADAVVRDRPDTATDVFAALVGRISGAVDATLGIDPHVANWAIDERGEAVLLDVGTPMLRDAHGTDLVDLRPYRDASPAILRPVIGRLATSLLDPYFTRRGTLADLGANLQKADLAARRRVFLDLANAALDAPLTERELTRAYRRDARLWQFLQAARRLDRRWQVHVRRRSYAWPLPPTMDRHL